MYCVGILILWQISGHHTASTYSMCPSPKMRILGFLENSNCLLWAVHSFAIPHGKHSSCEASRKGVPVQASLFHLPAPQHKTTFFFPEMAVKHHLYTRDRCGCVLSMSCIYPVFRSSAASAFQLKAI